MASVVYLPVSVTKRRWWACGVEWVDGEEYILAATRSKARYMRWLQLKDAGYEDPITCVRVRATARDPVYDRVEAPRPPAPKKERRTISYDDWLAEGRQRFGEDPLKWRFMCVACGETQTLQDFLDAGLSKDEAMSHIYFSCIGRLVKGRGCNWSLGGLFQINTLTVVRDGKSTAAFEFAD